MANKAINDLLKYGSIGLNETFNTTYVPASVNTTYSNFYRNWSIRDQVYDFNGTKGQFDGTKFICSCGTNANSQQISRIYRSSEGYSLGRKMSTSFKFRLSTPSGEYGHSMASFSLFGNPLITTLQASNSTSIMGFGGIEINFIHNSYYGNYIKLGINGTAVQTASTSLPVSGIDYYVWVDINNKTVEYSISTTNSKPATPQHTYTASSITVLSNNIIFAIGNAASNNSNNSAYIDDVNILLL